MHPSRIVRGLGVASGGVVVGMLALAAPMTAVAAPPENVTTVTVQKGDTLVKISERTYGSPNNVAQIARANGIADPNRIYAGSTLVIPPVPQPASNANAAGSGALIVQRGDTLRQISGRVYGDEARFPEIAEANGIPNPDRIVAGERLKLPGVTALTTAEVSSTVADPRQRGIGGSTGQGAATEPASLSIAAPASSVIWPARGVTVKGGEFGAYRGGTGAFATHTGLDIAAPQGTAITSAAAGKVSHAGPEGSYGNTIVIDHGGGMQTRYAHLLSWKVNPGDMVNQGQLIGLMGSTGFSTGPHLHFEVIKNGQFVSPLSVLPGQ